MLASGGGARPFSGESLQFAFGLEESVIIIWDTRTWQPLHRLLGHTGSVSNLVWSPDGRSLASSSIDSTVILWDIPR